MTYDVTIQFKPAPGCRPSPH